MLAVEDNVKAYSRPTVRELGRMDSVTRKTGTVAQDIDSNYTDGSNLSILQQIICFLTNGGRPYCSLDN